jgi:hypothetical protein
MVTPVGSWATIETGPFLDKVEDIGRPFYAGWARLLRDALDADAAAAGPPPVLPLHLRAAPGLPAAGDTRHDWFAALLAPVRSGVVLTRWDLRRAATELGMSARVGERRLLRSSWRGPGGGHRRIMAGGRAAVRHGASEPAPGRHRVWAPRRASELALRSAA